MDKNLTLTQHAKKFSQRFPGIVQKKRAIWHKLFNFNRINVQESFPAFATTSAGEYSDISAITLQSINQTFPALSRFVDYLELRKADVVAIESFPKNDVERDSVNKIIKKFQEYRSDKGGHWYHNAYGAILSNTTEIRNVLEIGMGTNHTDVVSNMGFFGSPGASLRAFRDYLPNANIYGADIDTRILFEEERIKTFFVDQTDPAAFVALDNQTPYEFDLIIDDGLHSPDANINTLQFALPKLCVGGWFVVEDIALDAADIWNVIFALIPTNYKLSIYKARYTLFVAIQRVS